MIPDESKDVRAPFVPLGFAGAHVFRKHRLLVSLFFRLPFPLAVPSFRASLVLFHSLRQQRLQLFAGDHQLQSVNHATAPPD